MSPIRSLLRRLARRLGLTPGHTQVLGSVIPSPDRRWCGPEFKDDVYYVQSAEREAQRLARYLGYEPGQRVLDVGCGQGRLAIGLLRVEGQEVAYTGLDVDQRSVEWCRRHIERAHPRYRFRHLDVYNARYHPTGGRLGEEGGLGVEPASADIIYLYSVFSHMTQAEMVSYLREFQRILRPGGRVFFTTFVEEGVAPVAVNPEDGPLRAHGPLHVVRYEKRHLLSLLEAEGFAVTRFEHGVEADRQSAIYLRRVIDGS